MTNPDTTSRSTNGAGMRSHSAYRGCRHYAVSQPSVASGPNVVALHDHLASGAREPSVGRYPSPDEPVDEILE